MIRSFFYTFLIVSLVSGLPNSYFSYLENIPGIRYITNPTDDEGEKHEDEDIIKHHDENLEEKIEIVNPNDPMPVDDLLDQLNEDLQKSDTAEKKQMVGVLTKLRNAVLDESMRKVNVLFKGMWHLVDLGVSGSSQRMRSAEKAEGILAALRDFLNAIKNFIFYWLGISTDDESEKNDDEKDKDEKDEDDEEDDKKSNKKEKDKADAQKKIDIIKETKVSEGIKPSSKDTKNNNSSNPNSTAASGAKEPRKDEKVKNQVNPKDANADSQKSVEDDASKPGGKKEAKNDQGLAHTQTGTDHKSIGTIQNNADNSAEASATKDGKSGTFTVNKEWSSTSGDSVPLTNAIQSFNDLSSQLGGTPGKLKTREEIDKELLEATNKRDLTNKYYVRAQLAELDRKKLGDTRTWPESEAIEMLNEMEKNFDSKDKQTMVKDITSLSMQPLYYVETYDKIYAMINKLKAEKGVNPNELKTAEDSVFSQKKFSVMQRIQRAPNESIDVLLSRLKQESSVPLDSAAKLRLFNDLQKLQQVEKFTAEQAQNAYQIIGKLMGDDALDQTKVTKLLTTVTQRDARLLKIKPEDFKAAPAPANSST